MGQDKQMNDFGTMTGIIIVIILLLSGAIYFGSQRMKQVKEFKASIQEASATTTSDEIPDIENDANSINTNSLGNGINNL